MLADVAVQVAAAAAPCVLAAGTQLCPRRAAPTPRRDYAPSKEALQAAQDPAAALPVEPDPASLHGGCPMLAEDSAKFIVTRWMRSTEFH